MTDALTVVVPDGLAGSRADRALAELLDLPVGAVRRLLLTGRVRVDGKKPKKGDAVRAGARVVLEGMIAEGGGSWLVPKASADVTVLYEDAGVVVVDKPAGMPSHPLVPAEGGTLVDAVAALHPEIAGASEDPREAGLVHRLDTGTSGCLAVARDRETWRALRDAFAAGTVEKGYAALVEGRVTGPLVVDTPIAHDPRDARRMIVAEREGQAATTIVKPLVVGSAHSLVAIEAHGGRRHQIRVHLASAGHPLAGDGLYGAREAADAPFHLLHASSLRLVGPPGRPLVKAPLPRAFVAAMAVRGLAPPPEGI